MSRPRPDVAIVGGGIAGLVTALCLDAAGVGCEVWERVPGCPELGVGINLLPPAVEVLARLGLLDELDRHGIRTSELILATRRGQHVWREPRGQAAGHAAPQLSVHRGHLHGVLQRAVRDRLGDRRVHLGVAVEPGALPDARIVLGADGIHSVVRTTIVGDGPPRWNGVLMWRGATPSPPFLDGSTMIVAGGTTAKAVVYPIGPAPRGLRLTNWAVVVRVAEDGATPPRREDWSRLAELADVQWQLGRFDIAEVDLPGLVATTERIYEYPMCDRDPLPTWTHGNVTLIGDAAHPMYPMGSNGGTQAILDAEAFARHVSTTTSTADALAAYEDERRPVTSAIVAVNRAGGPERVIDLVEARGPHGFARRADVLDDDELRALLAEYGRLTLPAR